MEKDSELRTIVRLRLTDVEAKDWRARAEAAGQTISDWIRERCREDRSSRAEDVPRAEDSSGAQRGARALRGRAESAEGVAAPASGISEAEKTVMRKMNHPFGCRCYECENIRQLLNPKKEKR